MKPETTLAMTENSFKRWAWECEIKSSKTETNQRLLGYQVPMILPQKETLQFLLHRLIDIACGYTIYNYHTITNMSKYQYSVHRNSLAKLQYQDVVSEWLQPEDTQVNSPRYKKIFFMKNEETRWVAGYIVDASNFTLVSRYLQTSRQKSTQNNWKGIQNHATNSWHQSACCNVQATLFEFAVIISSRKIASS